MDHSKLAAEVESRRIRAGLTQESMAAACGISQGHYSKLVRGEVAVGRKCMAALTSWLAAQGDAAASVVVRASAVRLAASILRDCRRLAQLVGPDGRLDATERGTGGAPVDFHRE